MGIPPPGRVPSRGWLQDSLATYFDTVVASPSPEPLPWRSLIAGLPPSCLVQAEQIGGVRRLRGQEAWILVLLSCVTLSNSFNLPGPQVALSLRGVLDNGLHASFKQKEHN